MEDASFETMRRAMVANQLRVNAVSDPIVLAAIDAVPREAFVPPALRALAYVDTVLSLGQGRAINPPFATGRLLGEAAPRMGEHALVVGAATGYSAAVLAEIGLTVVALEDASIAPAAAAGSGVQWINGPLAEGWPAFAPYDLILVDGAIEAIPDALVAQLRDGGRLAAAVIERGVSRLVIGRKAGGGFGTEAVVDAEAAPLPGFATAAAFIF